MQIPASQEAENYVLSALLTADSEDSPLSQRAASLVFEKLDEVDFVSLKNRIIFRHLKELYQSQAPLEIISLTESLQANGDLEKVGKTYILELISLEPVLTNIEHYINIIKEKSLLRRLLHISNDIQQKISSGVSAQELLAYIEETVFTVASSSKTSTLKFADVIPEVLDKLNKIYSKKIKITGIPTGFIDLDKKTSGFQKGNLIVIAARPSMGKTALALNIAANVAIRSKIPVAIFSLEMPAIQLANRILCSESRINLQNLNRGEITEDELARFVSIAHSTTNAPIFIDDTSSITIYELRARARRLKLEKNIGLIVIDYLQLLSTGRRKESKQQEVAEISRILKLLAMELDIPIIALSQLNRSPELRQDKRPTLADLRESGAIEQDADMVIFIYRDEYYNPDTELKNIAELIIAKHRNGPVGTVNVAFFSNYTRFDNLVEGEV